MEREDEFEAEMEQVTEEGAAKEAEEETGDAIAEV